MVKKKEAQLGVPLFDRNSKPLRLTEFGVQYINYLEKIWNLEHEYEKCLSDVRGLRTGRLSIGAGDSDECQFLGRVVIEIRCYDSKRMS